MHSSLRIGDTGVNASDGHCQGKPVFSGISLSLSVANDAEAERLFGALADGGKVNMPLAKTFFSSRFGLVTDRSEYLHKISYRSYLVRADQSRFH